MRLFQTRHQGCAALLRYTLGPNAHIKTYREPQGITFVFDDTSGKCRDISHKFFDDDNEGPFSVSDGRALLDHFATIRRTMTAAINAPTGEWVNTGEIENE
ncbi:hypothetical protein SAMN05444167_3969 [Terriglobus roseus]|uniref:Uncharacterized protein n=1 Tax=Terriglobus roseus TaxID=392734 RepID=A0A1G7QT85_9BACT|nr:hypothetical protein SAMN05444167_3969 [Terriglobus roseus]